MDTARIREQVEAGKAVLGIELGSTRIKAILIDETNVPIASGSFGWENRLKMIFGPIIWKTCGPDYRSVIGI